MHVRIWEFHVVAGAIPPFEAAYGPAGAWAELFRRHPDYLGTELLRDPRVPGRYVTVDRWRSEVGWETFRASQAAAYTALDAECSSLTLHERDLGSFELVQAQ